MLGVRGKREGVRVERCGIGDRAWTSNDSSELVKIRVPAGPVRGEEGKAERNSGARRQGRVWKDNVNVAKLCIVELHISEILNGHLLKCP